jgi:hypothetical protein
MAHADPGDWLRDATVIVAIGPSRPAGSTRDRPHLARPIVISIVAGVQGGRWLDISASCALMRIRPR